MLKIDTPPSTSSPRVRGLDARFESRILPLFQRRSPEIANLLPELSLHGLSRGDFTLALRGLLGDAAPLSASSVQRLTEDWQHERQRFHHDYRLRFPKACNRLDRDWARMLTYYPFPKAHWRLLRVAEKRFRTLNAPARCRDVYRGVRYADGVEVPAVSFT
jgi:hypothetical protein